MNFKLSLAGGASKKLSNKATEWWLETASAYTFDCAGFDPKTTFETRLAWAMGKGFETGTIYSRFSTKLQHSTDDQVRECIQWAARNGIYVPPELISVDEGVKGKRTKRVGLDRAKEILRDKLAKVLLVYKASRLFRQAGKGYQFINEQVVGEGLRAVSVSQGIDTDDRKTWRLQLQIHGIMDEMLLDAIADHVRSGLTGLFLNNWTTGAVGIGYRRKEIPGALRTNRGKPRTMPEVDPSAAALIREHARLLLDGMPIREGVRRWHAAGGPVDPRASSDKIGYSCYRRLFTNERLTGRWEFGRKRNQFSTKLDSVKQVEQPDDEVATLQCEELRILNEETFAALVVMFEAKKTGPRGPRKPKALRLWDLTTEFFFCECCSTSESPVRFYQTGANGNGMHCKNGDQCPKRSTVRREEAAKAVCSELTKQISQDAALIESVILRSQELDSQPDEDLEVKLNLARKQLATLNNRVNDLFELSGQGTEEDRKETKSRLRIAQTKRNALRHEVSRLQKTTDGTTNTLTADQIRDRLSEMSSLLTDAASGVLGDDGVLKALAVFRALTGGQIWVRVEKRPKRKRTNVLGTFTPKLLQGFDSKTNTELEKSIREPATVWLRKPPRLDLIAQRVHELIDIEGLSHRETAKQLQKEGHKVNSGNVWYSYRRWYEMQGKEPPKVPYNNGKTRRRA